MKKNAAPLLPAVLMVFITASALSCASGSGAAKTPQPEQPRTASASADADAKDKEVIADKAKAPLLERETRYFSTGAVDMRKEYLYADGTDKFISSVTYDTAENIFESVLTDYTSDSAVFSYYDREKTLLKKTEETFDSTGNIIKSVLFDTSGRQISRSSYNYDSSGSRTKWEIYDSSDTLLAYNVYNYVESRNVRIDSFSPSGVLEEYFVSDFDNTGNKTKTSQFSKNGSLKGMTVYTYGNSRPVNVKRYRGEKTLLDETVYSYSEYSGRLIEKSTISGMDGKIIEIIEKEWRQR